MTVDSPSVISRVFSVQGPASGAALPSSIAWTRAALIALSVDAISGETVGIAALKGEANRRHAIVPEIGRSV